MKATALILTAVLMAAIAWIPAATQDRQVLFERALALEEAQGRLQEAIALYQKIVDEASDKSLAAQAQLRIGICHQKLGHKEAQSAFQKVIDNYPGQAETVRLAREQLSLLVKAQAVLENKNQEPTIRQVWSGAGVDMFGAPSPDGKYLSFVDWDTGDLAIRDLETGKNRRLTNKKGAWNESAEEALSSRWSPKGDQIAYQWCEREGHPVEICVVALDGSRPRILYSAKENEWAELYDWSPDGKQILASLPGNQLSLISVADGTIRALKTDKKETTLARFSPDGRYIVYDAPQAVDSLDRDIFVLSLDGDREIPLVAHPADDSVIGWAPNGKWVLFASDRTGSLCFWAVPVAEGKPQGSPKIIKSASRRTVPLGFARDGRFFFGESSAAEDVYTIKIDPASGKVLSPPEKSIKRFEGSNSRPRYSPDGKYLAYCSERGNLGTEAVLLCIHSLETGNDREFYAEFKRFGISQVVRPRWSPNSQSILVNGLRRSGPGVGIYRLSVQTGDVTPIVQSIEGYGVSVEWHPDGKSIIYVRSDNTSDLVHILRRELEGGAEKEIYSFPAPQNLEIAVSPDGRWLSSKITVSKTERIFRIVALSGSVSRDLVRRKTEDGSLPYRHAWSADGKYIFFSRKRVNELTWDLWRVSTEGGAEPQKLDVSMPWVIDHLTAHPDNRTFAFTSGRSSVADSGIWVMENLPLFAK